MNVALIDAGPMVALFDRDDPAHERYRAMVAALDAANRLHTTWPCVTEAAHLLSTTDRILFLRWVGAGGVQVFPFDPPALLDMTPWMQTYTETRKRKMSFADASLYWLANETGVTCILTTDVRDFSRYRLPDGRSFELL
jgi:uncharacterized protein